jgi:two-component system, chemotaxis family, sensor kinase CheA
MSLRVRVGLGTVAVLLAVGLVLQWQLARRDLTNLVEARRDAASMLADLASETLAAPLDAHDEDGVAASSDNLRVNREVVEMTVWARGGDVPVLRFSRLGASPDDVRVTSDDSQTMTLTRVLPPRAPPLLASTMVVGDHIVATRIVRSRSGREVGAAEIVLSIEDDLAAHERARLQMLLAAALVSLIAAGLVMVVVQRQIVRPLRRLRAAARWIERGVTSARADVHSDDEVGDLATAFNAMADATADRELRLENMTRNLRDLFDNMREAIVAFDEHGVIRGATSRQAKRLFGGMTLEGRAVRDVLYPDAPAYDIDAASFAEWLPIAFSTPPSDWASCESFAPREVLIAGANGEKVPLDLEFRPVVRDGRIDRIMLLATDVSLQRELAQVVQAQEAEHGRKIAAMRKLIAGGTQVFVGFAEATRMRLSRCDALLARNSERIPTEVLDALFREVHTIRGDATSFDLVDLAAEAKKLEEDLDEARARVRGDGLTTTKSWHGLLAARLGLVRSALEQGCALFASASPVGGAVFDQITVQRRDLDALLACAKGRSDRIAELATRLAARPFGETAAAVMEGTPLWASAEGKEVALVVESREVMVPAALARVLPGVLGHLVRNAIAHGIETPSERRASGKPEKGNVRLSAAAGERGVAVTVADDGAGMNLPAIRARASALGVAGASEVDLVFTPGFSTRAAANDVAGRGVGLDAVRDDLARAGFEVRVVSEDGKGTRFEIAAATPAVAARNVVREAQVPS